MYAVSFYQRAIAPSGGRTAESFTLDTYVGLCDREQMVALGPILEKIPRVTKCWLLREGPFSVAGRVRQRWRC